MVLLRTEHTISGVKRVKQPKFEADRSSHFNAKINDWSFKSTPSNVFMEL